MKLEKTPGIHQELHLVPLQAGQHMLARVVIYFLTIEN